MTPFVTKQRIASKALHSARSAVARIAHHDLLLMVIWSLWLAFPYFGFGAHSYVRLHDCADSQLVYSMILGSWFAHHEYWYWNLLTLSGLDSLWTLPRLKLDIPFFAVMPQWLAYGSVAWLQRFVAGYFTLRLAKDVFGLGHWPAIWAGLSYALFSHGWINGSWDGFTHYDLLLLPGVPFILWFLTKMNPRRVLSHGVALLLGALFSTFTIYAYTLFFFPLIAYWFIAIVPRWNIRFWIMVFFFGVGYLLMEAPVLWAAYLNAPLSQRSYWTPFSADSFVSLSLGLRSFLYSMVEMTRDNAVPFLLILMGMIATPRLPKKAASLFQISLLIFAVQGAWLFVLPAVQERLGFLVGFNFSRFSLYVPFMLVIAGAMCVDSIEKSWRFTLSRGETPQVIWELRRVLIILAVVVVVAQSIAVNGKAVLEAAEGHNFANFFRHRAFELVAAKKNEDQPFRVATLVEGYRGCPHPAFAWAYSLESVDGYFSIYSRRYQEYWGAVLAPLTAVSNRIKSYFWSWGCRVYLFSPDYFASVASQTPDRRPLLFSDWYNLNLLSLCNAKYIVSPVPLLDSNLKLILSPTEDQIAWKANPSRFEKINGFLRGKSPGFALHVYENLLALPRFSLMGKTIVFQDKTELLEALEKADHKTIASNAFLLASDVSGLPLQELRAEKGAVLVRDYSFDTMTLTTSCASPSILVAANSWSPYWRAWVDGTEALVFPANHAFQGVYCPSGRHEVVLRYLPPYRLGSVGSVAIWRSWIKQSVN